MKHTALAASLQKAFVAILAMCLANSVRAQHDSLILKNGNTIVGEIKSMDKGILTIETDYSDVDFAIEWSGVKEIYSKSRFLLTLEDGRRINGSMQSADGGKKIVITDIDGKQIETTPEDLVYIKGLKSDFWSRSYALIDVGFNITKANNLKQFSARTTFGYLADKWQLDFLYDALRSSQDSVETTKRTEAGISFKYFLQNDWYLAASTNFLSNTEQALDLRFTGKLGAGKYIVHSNKAYWGVGAGLSNNNESFTNGTPSRNSLEGYVGTELNIFDIGDLNLISSLFVYPSFTESGRWRTDFKLDAKYDLPLDFYIKTGLTVNYDNKAAVAGNETDYVFGISFGWEL
jgi:small nuclear ribonucleoprotein (snRNP)-like protein